MEIRRIVPNIATTQPDVCREFYESFLGLKLAMDMGWIVTYVSPSNPTAQVSIVTVGQHAPAAAVSITFEAEDVDQLHADAVARGYTILYPLTDEPWGVRRFGVEDPNGVFINIMRHTQAPT